MATSDSIQLAQSVIDRINNIKRSKRAMAESDRTTLSEIDSIIVNPEKKAILVSGLAGMSVDVDELKNEKDALVAVNQHVLDNVPPLTK